MLYSPSHQQLNMSMFYSAFFFLLIFLMNGMANGKKHHPHLKKGSKPNKTAFGDVTLTDGCAQTTLGDPAYGGEIEIPPASWIQTPAIEEVTPGGGHYRVLSRIVHMEHLKEQLQQKGLSFDEERLQVTLVNQLDIQADIVYVQNTVALHGIRNINVIAREIVASSGSQLDFTSPAWNRGYENLAPGVHGEAGKPGESGPIVQIIAGNVRGSLGIVANGGNGERGQDGAKGINARPNNNPTNEIPRSECEKRGSCKSSKISGNQGHKGYTGGQGGDAGVSGNGGDAGHITIRAETISGKVILMSCGGRGGEAATNGPGGNGGDGGTGGNGRYCKEIWQKGYGTLCKGGNTWHVRGDPGDQGDTGPTGTTNTVAADGNVDSSWIQSGQLDDAAKQSYTADLLLVIKRQAEDTLLADNTDESGKAALRFIVMVGAGRTDVEHIVKEAKRKLGFLGKEGFDIFGRNKLYAPLVVWDSKKEEAENIRDAASVYEEAYNELQVSLSLEVEFEKVADHMSEVGKAQVKTEKERLIAANETASSKKRIYTKTIVYYEDLMPRLLTEVERALPEAVESAKFNKDDTLAVLQGLVGFASSALARDPLSFIDNALTLASQQANKYCVSTLDQYMSNIKKWLTFGAHYDPLVDSSDLNFDEMDVASVPEVMQVNLDLNKEALTEDLVCLVQTNSRDQDTAELTRLIESFFIVASARVDAIGIVMDLDNEIGGYNFDIHLLNETEYSIKNIGKPDSSPLTDALKLKFLENLLATYDQMQHTFMMAIDQVHRALKFRLLWEGIDLLSDFSRVASESAHSTGRLNGILQLTDVLLKVEKVERQARDCFTRNPYATGIHKWSFDITQDTQLFQDLVATGNATFSIDILNSCTTCYNTRIKEVYIELYGDESQPETVPDKVYLELRHQGASHFRAGDGSIKEYRQPLGAYRKITFDRFTITDTAKCNEEKRRGNQATTTFCITSGDNRWETMCRNPFGEENVDTLLGDEECKSPYGVYDLNIPVDPEMSCDSSEIANRNCKDLDLTKFTKMNFWVHYWYWSEQYPVGPDDEICQ